MRTDKEMSVLFEQCLQDLTGLGIKPAVIDNVTYKRLQRTITDMPNPIWMRMIT